MTDEEIIAVVTAHNEGKVIEYCSKTEGTWHTCPSNMYWNFGAFNYRIKPEPRYRPFENADEVMEAIREHGDWVKNIEKGWYLPVLGVTDITIKIQGDWYVFEQALNLFTFYDGTPFGKMEDEK